MAEMKWTYVADSGQQYHVALYHGNSTGHVMVAVNDKVTIVDFFVQDTKSYTLLLEEELFSLELEKGPKGFGYAFTIDRNTDTLRNRQKKKDLVRQYVITGIVIIAFLSISIFAILKFQHFQDDKLAKKSMPYLEEIGHRTMGRLGTSSAGDPVVYYVVRKSIFSLPFDERLDSLPDFKPGDDIQVAYLNQKPAIAQILWQLPGPLRGRRLFDQWAALKFISEAKDTNQVFGCVLLALRSDSTVISDKNAPWHKIYSSNMNDWLSQRPDILARLATACPGILQADQE